MKFLNIGPLELFFIVLLAFIFLGPKKLVKTIGDIGRWVRDFIKSPLWQDIVSSSNEIRDLPNKLLKDDDESIKKSFDDLNQSSKNIRNSLIDLPNKDEKDQ